jgi:hypothetical protein
MRKENKMQDSRTGEKLDLPENYERQQGLAEKFIGEYANVHIEHYFPKGYNPDDEPWKSIRSHHNAALAAEREKLKRAQDFSYLCHKQLSDERDANRGLFIESGKRYQQLIAAQAAIKEHNRHSPPYDWIGIDATVLAEHDAALVKPLVEALEKARRNLHPASSLRDVIDAALAQVKEGK